MEVVEASPDLAPILASYAKECLESGIPKYFGVDQDPEAYLSGLAERSKATSELPNGYLPSTTYYCVSGSEILGAIRIRKGTNANVENVIGHVGYETRPSARGKGVASFLLAWVRDHVVTDSVIVFIFLPYFARLSVFFWKSLSLRPVWNAKNIKLHRLVAAYAFHFTLLKNA